MTKKYYKRLPLKNVSNLRDLGGIPTEQGKMVAWGKFLRSSHLSRINDEEITFLEGYGVRTIIDLRLASEREKQKSLETDLIENIHISLLNDEEKSLASLDSEKIKDIADFDLFERYKEYLQNKDNLKRIFDVIFSKNDGGVLYHCSAGKDRTGLISMLILGLLDVSKADIVADYQISYTLIKEERQHMPTDYILNVLNSNPENISKTYDYVIEVYGSIVNFFKDLGYTQETLENFKIGSLV